MTAAPLTWTSADSAELDVLVHTLAFDFWKHKEYCEACNPEPCPELEGWHAHRAACRACQGDAPLTYGPLCPERARLLAEHHDCVRCLPCPNLQAAIAEVVDWRQARLLLSKAHALRAMNNEAA